MSAGDRYEELSRRAHAGHGGFTAAEALQLMSRPVAMKSNLHNVLFAPKSTDFWVAHAGTDRTPAAERPFQKFSLRELLSRRPDASSPEIPMAPRTAAKPARASE